MKDSTASVWTVAISNITSSITIVHVLLSRPTSDAGVKVYMASQMDRADAKIGLRISQLDQELGRTRTLQHPAA